MAAIPETSETLAHEAFETASKWLEEVQEAVEELLKKLPRCQCCNDLAFWVLHKHSFLCDEHRFYLPEAPEAVPWAAAVRELKTKISGRFLVHDKRDDAMAALAEGRGRQTP